MCILFLHTDSSAPPNRFRLILASNRDEHYRRPARQAHFWEEDSTVVGGRDMEPGREGGTWLALSSRGRVAVLLSVMGENVADPSRNLGRGFLVTDFVTNEHNQSQDQYLKRISEEGKKYNPFSFVCVDISASNVTVQQYSNATGSKDHAEKVGSGPKGWGNSGLSRPFCKVTAGTSRFKEIVETHGTTDNKETLVQELLSLLKCDKSNLPDPELERRLVKSSPSILEKSSHVFVHIPERGYGTRTHTIILIDVQGHIDFMEWTMKEPIDAENPTWSSVRHSCQLAAA